MREASGYRIVEVPVRSKPRIAGESKVSGTLKGTAHGGLLPAENRASLCLEGLDDAPWSK